jgi:hypothetical protein
MTQKNPGKASWKKPLLDGLFMLAGAAFLFWYFTDFENSHDPSRSINWIAALLYNFGGKWLVCSVFAAIAVWQFAAALRQRREEEQ